jgi:hypothetical protein
MSFIQAFPSGKGGGGGGGDIQHDSLPAASAAELGHIYQYTGVTTSTYTRGCFYECIYDEEHLTYKWTGISTEDDSVYEDEDIDFNNF